MWTWYEHPYWWLRHHYRCCRAWFKYGWYADIRPHEMTWDERTNRLFIPHYLMGPDPPEQRPIYHVYKLPDE